MMTQLSTTEAGKTIAFQTIGILRTPHQLAEHTPLLDIKPFVPRFDQVQAARGGWTEEVDELTARRRGERGCRP